MNDDADRRTEDHLRRALAARDVQVRPSRGALDAIRAQTAGPGPWRRRAPLLLAAVAVLIAGIVGVAALSNDDDALPDVAIDDTTTTVASPTTQSPSTTATSSTSIPTTTIPSTSAPENLAADGLIVWPRDSRSFSSMEAAADTYVTEVLGVADPILEYDCCDGRVAIARLLARGEGGRELDRDATEITLVETDGTWDVVLVESETMVIESAASAPDAVVVTGRGTAFEGTGVLTTTSSCDPDAITTEIVQVGAGPDEAPFTSAISAPDCPVTIIQLTDPPVADGATPSVASLAVPTRQNPTSS